MAKRKSNLNTIYISERLQECLRPISRSAITTVVAPMGYGKTTAINWYLSVRAKVEELRIVRISVYSDNPSIFWKSVQNAFSHAEFEFLHDYAYPSDVASEGLLADDFCHELAGEQSCYIFIDDFHLLTNIRVCSFLCAIANRLPDNVHIIVASRDRFLPAAEIVRLGSKVYQIGIEHLRLNHTEIGIYARRCGTELSDNQIETLLSSSEGWFSAVYLNLRAFAECGTLPDHNSDIYTMFIAAMIEPLPEKQREFLAVMGLADEFTAEMAQFFTGNSDVENLLAILTERNAFVSQLSDGVTYRFHHMMKECTERTFLTLKKEDQSAYLDRIGLWYENHQQYLHAMAAYKRSGNYEALLRVISKDAGIMLATLNPLEVQAAIEECPDSVLKNHPFALLVLMRRMFTWRMIPKMTKLKELLLASITEHPEMPQSEQDNLLGECDLIMSFLMYNDISAMSRLHRSASAKMSRPAISIQNVGGWSFDSPSVLMMFHREPGELSKELAEMDECMPHYYKITNGHGQGAEKIMSAEAAFMQGRFVDAQIGLESAYAQIELESAYAHIKGSGQENMVLCCDFLARRLSLCVDIEQRYTFEQRYSALLSQHNASWMNLFHATCAYYYALLGMCEKVPEIFRSHMLSSVNILAPGKPMIEMIENQVSLAQGAYAKVIGRNDGLFSLCEGLHYGLVALHLRIQAASAYEMLGKRTEARLLLKQALRDATPDDFLLPFVENYGYLKELLQSCGKGQDETFIQRIMQLGTAYETRQKQMHEINTRPTELSTLTQREYQIVKLMAERMSNREIAEKLFLSEGSVKQYANQIYSKLHIMGDTWTKRQQILVLMNPNP
ncbi:MAG: LuxR C-terminal-related transcriptional regulator [Dehalobacterium sp.]|jgi:LuxR family maltose regulon positive regulatory protein